jgi:hypothetical protein
MPYIGILDRKSIDGSISNVDKGDGCRCQMIMNFLAYSTTAGKLTWQMTHPRVKLITARTNLHGMSRPGKDLVIRSQNSGLTPVLRVSKKTLSKELRIDSGPYPVKIPPLTGRDF